MVLKSQVALQFVLKRLIVFDIKQKAQINKPLKIQNDMLKH